MSFNFPVPSSLSEVHRRALPQPPQLCGPWSAWVVAQALSGHERDLAGWARAIDARIIKGYRDTWREREAPVATVPEGLGKRDRYASLGATGRNIGVALSQEDLKALPVSGWWTPENLQTFAAAVAAVESPVSVIANVHTKYLGVPSDAGFKEPHFQLWTGLDPEAGTVSVLDTYPELGDGGAYAVDIAEAAAALNRKDQERGGILLVFQDHLAALEFTKTHREVLPSHKLAFSWWD